MKLNIRRIYCSNCQRLVRGREQRANGSTRISCPKCSKLLWIWAGVSWRHGGLSNTGAKA